MSDAFYMFVYGACWPAFAVSSSPLVLHRDRARRRGAYILAANHLSVFDVPCLIKDTPRLLDFVSIVEVFRNPPVAWFFSSMNAFPLDRGRVDPATARIILDRLRRGRVVAMFPEGRIRNESESVIHGAPFKRGIARLAQLAGVPIVPCVVLGTGAYTRVASWVPLRRTRYGVNYGQPIPPAEDHQATEAALRQAYLDLYEELHSALRPAAAGSTRDKNSTH